MKLMYWDEEAYVAELIVSLDPVTTQDERSAKGSMAALPEAEGVRAVKDNEKTKKRKAEVPVPSSTSAKKAAPSHLQFWSNRHAELHGLEQKGSGNANDSENPVSKSIDGSEQADAPPLQSFADPKRNCCYLCSRQFKTAAEVNKHERLSDLHRENLRKEDLVAKAKAKLEKHGVQPQQPATEYRDRAKERRKAYGVVNKKGQQISSTSKTSKQLSDDEDAAPIPSKGASLLSKMGYTVGKGLGASGSGMTAPISQDVYVPGVGLGAQGGKAGDAVLEAERNTKGDYSGFAERTREGARERYSRM
jgi:hypothetical protein